MMGRTKNALYDEAEIILDRYSSYVVYRVLTLNEAIDDLLYNEVVTMFFNRDEIEAVLSFELQKGHTVQ
jgi:hypothetical protein